MWDFSDVHGSSDRGQCGGDIAPEPGIGAPLRQPIGCCAALGSSAADGAQRVIVIVAEPGPDVDPFMLHCLAGATCRSEPSRAAKARSVHAAMPDSLAVPRGVARPAAAFGSSGIASAAPETLDQDRPRGHELRSFPAARNHVRT